MLFSLERLLELVVIDIIGNFSEIKTDTTIIVVETDC